MDGSDGGPIVNVYKDQGSAFIRCHYIESNQESVHILQKDETISDGIFRKRWDNGDTAIGSKYFRRSGRKEGKMYRLFTLNESGNIYYEDRIFVKDDSAWRDLAVYIFNQETLELTEFEDE